MHRSDHLIVLSHYMREKLLKIHRIPDCKITLIPGGVDTIRFFPAQDRGMIRKRLRIPDDRVVAFTVRNLVPRMGLGNLIQAVKAVIGEHPEILLVMGGDGPLRERLSEQIRSNGLEAFVRMTGFISEADLPDYYRMADFFVLPTLELEGFGMVTLEAMASGIPVLGTPVGGTGEILGPHFPEMIFPGTDPAAIADLLLKTVRRMQNDPKRWQRLGERCRKIAEIHYSWDSVIDQMEVLFQERGRKCLHRLSG